MSFQGVTAFRTITIQTMLDPRNEPSVKQFFVMDSDGDPTNIYYAQAAASAGEKCLEQVLQYITNASGVKNVERIAWRKTVWSGSAWDIV